MIFQLFRKKWKIELTEPCTDALLPGFRETFTGETH